MSRLLSLPQASGAVILSACLMAYGMAARDAQVSADTAPVVVVGGFSNVRYTAEHAYGQEVELWRQGKRLLGLFMYTEGPQADFHTGLLENVSFDSATGRLSFDAYASQFHFEGKLETNAVRRLLKQMHPIDGRQVAANQIVLRRSRKLSDGMRQYTSGDEWTRHAAEVLGGWDLRPSLGTNTHRLGSRTLTASSPAGSLRKSTEDHRAALCGRRTGVYATRTMLWIVTVGMACPKGVAPLFHVNGSILRPAA
jgi:hypothetical protein